MIRPFIAALAFIAATPAFADDALLAACDAGDVRACQRGAAAARAQLNAKLDFTFVKKGCDLRDALACASVGEFYRHGIGTKQNYKRAYSYSKAACDAGVADGCLRVGFLYNEGQGVAQSKTNAQAFYRKACDLGYSGPVC